MKSKIKLVYSDYNEETGVSIARIQTPYGVFKGKARLNPQDADTASHYEGCKYAEMRAYIKYFKFMIKIKRTAYDELQKLYNQLKYSTPAVAQNDIVLNLINDYMTDLNNTIQSYKKAITKYTNNITKSINERETILNRIKKGQK